MRRPQPSFSPVLAGISGGARGVYR